MMAVSPAHAEDAAPLTQEVVISAEDYAKLIGAYGQVAPLQAELAVSEKSLANMTEQRDLLTKRIDAKDALIADLKDLAEIRKLRADEADKRGDRIASEKRKEGFMAKVQERASQGALVGTLAGSAVPGVGNLAGLVGGGAIGAIVGAIESLIQGP